ncbi:MAG: DUF4124 domain-containing protein [Colwellia sp.]|nr:DUF4124 domain-containing protein [Colwellia sp.]
MKILILLFVLTPLFSFADSVYKCTVDGVSTFSQTPCDDKYEKIEVDNYSGRETSQTEMNGAKQECFNLHMANFKFPESVRIEGSKRIWTTDNSGARQVLILELNSKNTDGAYSGSKSYRCYLNHSVNKLSKVQYLIK